MNMITFYDIALMTSGVLVLLFTYLRSNESARQDELKSHEAARIAKERQDTIISLHQQQREQAELHAKEITKLTSKHTEDIIQTQNTIHKLTEEKISTTSIGKRSLPKFKFEGYIKESEIIKISIDNFEGTETAFDVSGYFSIQYFDKNYRSISSETDGIIETIKFGTFNIGPGEPGWHTAFHSRGVGKFIITFMYTARSGQFIETLIIDNFDDNKWASAAQLIYTPTSDLTKNRFPKIRLFISPNFPKNKWAIAKNWN